MSRHYLIAVLVTLFLAASGAQANPSDDTFSVQLPCAEDLATRPPQLRDFYGDEWYDDTCVDDVFEIPNGRPVYALLVSGFHQNRDFDMFHWFNFAKYLQSRGAYVHYAWWNNLLAPYMERPLHDPDSVPSTGAFPLGTIAEARRGLDKAIPNDDFQFQQDARALLFAIRANNPDAKIILVGHSMGGVSVLRLAEGMPPGLVIDLLAPIDPVGNRSCIWDPWHLSLNPFNLPNDTSCNGTFNFTRWRAIRQDKMDDHNWDIFPWYPPKRPLGSVVNLYHRWQQEFTPPYDYACPGAGDDVPVPCLSIYDQSLPAILLNLFGINFMETDYLFDHHGQFFANVPDTYPGSLNIQSRVDTRLDSGHDVNVDLGNFGGGLDGHGELVGFRGAVAGIAAPNFWTWVVERLDTLGAFFNPFDGAIFGPDEVAQLLNFESYPLALKAEGNDWPSRADESNPSDPNDPVRLRRVALLKAWEKDPFHLFKNGHEPWNPGLCMVSSDLSRLLDFILPIVNQPPVADAGPDQHVPAGENCIGQVVLDGSGSLDPDGDNLTYSWTWNNGLNHAAGRYPAVELPPGVHEITLVVSDGEFDSGPDVVIVTVEDVTAPVLESVVAVPSSLWPPNHVLIPVHLTVVARDNCDASPDIRLLSVMSDEPDDAPLGGDGHTTGDIQSAEIGTEDYDVLLRAERQGAGDGRTYEIVYVATDDSENSGVSGTAVMVPHNNSEPKTGEPRGRTKRNR